ncbi:50S ribosomal protein L7Ae [Candidatus Nanohalococcus occultus]|uniref:50S ribosomal protein L7Ae n=1 Tax=Candidatus Nanohalococcus occultus TaxID=2978047 RepID=A0ABY8CHB5_9ARCH|nr:Ribosomal protein L7AE [Candidatus Nanohaloarchaeota archaeon SVXNc]
MATYTEFDVSDSLAEKTYNAVENAQNIRKGTNEVTKAIERNEAALVVVAGDVSPEEIVMHIPALADERDIAFTFVPEKEELGMAAGINVQTAAVAITTPGSAEDEVQDIVQKSNELREAEEE